MAQGRIKNDDPRTKDGRLHRREKCSSGGTVERLTFNASHYSTSDIKAYGTSLARTTTTTRDAGSNLVTAVVDGLSRRTEYTYDTAGHVLTATRLAGTSDAVTTQYPVYRIELPAG